MRRKDDDSIEKTYYKMREVVVITGILSSTLRFWETKFTIIKPFRENGQRYYSPKDIETINMIRYMIHEKGLKIEAAQQELRRNRQGVDKRFEVVERLKEIRSRIEIMLEALNRKR